MDKVEHQTDNELMMVQTITLMRIYDVLSAILSNMNPEDWNKLMTMHQQGTFMGPDPAYVGKVEDG